MLSALTILEALNICGSWNLRKAPFDFPDFILDQNIAVPKSPFFWVSKLQQSVQWIRLTWYACLTRI